MNKITEKLFHDKTRDSAKSWLIMNRVWMIYYGVGIVGIAMPATRDLFRSLIGISVMMSLVVLLLFHEGWSGRFMVAGIGVLVGGFMFELIGVNTGVIFGHYAYGKALGPGWLGTPFLIGFNWLLLIYLVTLVVKHLSSNRVLRWIIGAALMVGYDVFLEPMASVLGMWSWTNNAVPVQNYLAWYALSFVFLGLFDLLRVKYDNPVALTLLGSQLVFFVALNIIHQIVGL